MSAGGALPFDLEALGRWLAEQGLCDGPVTATRVGEGHSHLTYAVSDGQRSVVLRRPPPPPWPPKAYDVLREARIVRAVAGGVPVPRILAMADEQNDVMDVAFYVMEHLDGEVATTSLPPALDTPAERRRVGEALVDALAALHAVDWRAAGLDGIGRPEGFVERQLERLPRLLESSDGGVPASVLDLRDALAADMPAPTPGGGSVVHGDLRIGNVMLGRDAPSRILGVLDWELAGVGDPLTDLGYTLGTYAIPGEEPHILTEMSAVTLADGFPGRQALAERYAAATGHDVSRLGWYMGLALWKLAILFELTRRRGQDPFYDRPGLVDGLLAGAWQRFKES